MHARILRAVKGRSRPAAAGYFQGDVRSQDVTENETELEVVAVWFPAGGRTNCHIHPTEQVLIVTEGEIAVAIGTERYLLQPGELIVIPKNLWHWHGATPYGAGCHLSVKPHPAPGDWENAPSDEQAEFELYDDWESWLRGVG